MCQREFMRVGSRTRSRRTKTTVVVALLALTSCGPKPSMDARGRGVLVIAIDALRADHMGSMGYDRATTPMLDGLASQGVSFENTWSTSPEVLASHASILSGCDPLLARRPQVRASGPATELSAWYIPDGVPRLAQQFLAHGFATAAFVDHPAISQIHGFARGFQEFSGYREDAVLPQVEYGFEGVASKFMHWLVARDPAQSWFAYLHVDDLERTWSRTDPDPRWDTFFEPRASLAQVPPVAEGPHVFFAVPRARWQGGTLSLGEYEARYDGALRQLDGKLSRLLERMRRSGHLKNTTIVVVGTFGLSLGESGLYVDSGTLSDVDLHVPWILRPAPQFDVPRGAKKSQLASLLDLAPTLLEMHGIPIPKGMQGVSQKSLVFGSETPVRSIAFASGGLQEGRAAIDSRYCFERSFPGDREQDGVGLSWFGDEALHTREPRVFLHDRTTIASLGHLEDCATDAKAMARLSEAAREWFAWIDAARPVLHQPALRSHKNSAAIVEDLEKRGMLGDGR